MTREGRVQQFDRGLAQRRPTVASALNQHVEDLALVVEGTSQIHPLASDPHHHLAEVPAIARLRTTAAVGSALYGRKRPGLHVYCAPKLRSPDQLSRSRIERCVSLNDLSAAGATA